MPELTPFLSWVAHHARLFGLAKEEAATMAGWESTLDASPDELHAATAAIAGNPGETLGKAETRFVGKMSAHLEALTNAVKRIRTIHYERGADRTEHDWGTCQTCLSTGWVIVPHPEGVQDGEWVPVSKTRQPEGVYYTLAVTCSCAKGKWVASHRTAEGKTGWTLETYTRFNPLWREQVRRRRLAEEHYSASLEELSPAPEGWTAKLRRILENCFKQDNERRKLSCL